MSVVHQPVKDRVGDGGFADRLMPVIHRDLGGSERGTVPVTVVKNLKRSRRAESVRGAMARSSRITRSVLASCASHRA